MSANKLGEIIREERDVFKTPNIYDYLGNGNVEVFLENFRKNIQDREMVLFFEFDNLLYLPVWFEFRSINNNLLYLIIELSIKDFGTLRRILASSLEKEEHIETEIKALVYKTLKPPTFCHLLPNFKIAEEDIIVVCEG